MCDSTYCVLYSYAYPCRICNNWHRWFEGYRASILFMDGWTGRETQAMADLLFISILILLPDSCLCDGICLLCGIQKVISKEWSIHWPASHEEDHHGPSYSRQTNACYCNHIYRIALTISSSAPRHITWSHPTTEEWDIYAHVHVVFNWLEFSYQSLHILRPCQNCFQGENTSILQINWDWERGSHRRHCMYAILAVHLTSLYCLLSVGHFVIWVTEISTVCNNLLYVHWCICIAVPINVE